MFASSARRAAIAAAPIVVSQAKTPPNVLGVSFFARKTYVWTSCRFIFSTDTAEYMIMCQNACNSLDLLQVPARCASSAAAGWNLVFLGAPGVGKGTFAARVAKRMGIPAISTGDIIRAEIKAGSPLGMKIKEYSNSGRLVPDEVVNEMVKHRLSQADAQKGYILVSCNDTHLPRCPGGAALELPASSCFVRPLRRLVYLLLQDGFPRTVAQAEDLDSYQKVSRVLNITLPEHVLMAKMLARRVCGDCGKGYNLANIKEVRTEAAAGG